MTSIFGIAYSAGVLVAISIPILTAAAGTTGAYVTVTLVQQKEGWQTNVASIGGVDVS